MDFSVVCPVYNEADGIAQFLDELLAFIPTLKLNYEVILINDGSLDLTLEEIIQYKKKNTVENIRVINLSRNFGKEAALSAGLSAAKGEFILTMDSDLQHPVALIGDLFDKMKEGYDMVYARRTSRRTDPSLRRLFSNCFYKVHNSMSAQAIPNGSGDFRLIKRKVVDAINRLPENQRFMKGLFAWVGFKTTFVDYKPDQRAAGRSRFNGWRLWNFALDGITGFSTMPL